MDIGEGHYKRDFLRIGNFPRLPKPLSEKATQGTPQDFSPRDNRCIVRSASRPGFFFFFFTKGFWKLFFKLKGKTTNSVGFGVRSWGPNQKWKRPEGGKNPDFTPQTLPGNPYAGGSGRLYGAMPVTPGPDGPKPRRISSPATVIPGCPYWKFGSTPPGPNSINSFPKMNPLSYSAQAQIFLPPKPKTPGKISSFSPKTPEHIKGVYLGRIGAEKDEWIIRQSGAQNPFLLGIWGPLLDQNHWV
ncbi:MAG: hypothetical protein CM15mP130_1060 [Verrucomicrobiota bacterium]|nr:MAG: hypothetical protein CM15mP130_1060 [Verrucomicrobiota bacterium]